MSADARPLTVVVAGDVTIDWNIALRPRGARGVAWNARDESRACPAAGGASLMGDLVAAVARRLRASDRVNATIHSAPRPAAPLHPGMEAFRHSYATWKAFDDADSTVWRVHEFLGLDPRRAASTAESLRVADDPPDADLVILDDAALGFRDHRDLWPRAIREPGGRPWILLKMARPVTQGPLWEHLLREHADRLVAVVPVNDLREMEVQISQELSWESAAEDLLWELTWNPKVNALARCAHVVVSFYAAGALLLSRESSERLGARLFFDQQIVEGEWERSHPGRMIGYTSCLVAGLARAVMLAPTAPDLAKGIEAGLEAMRALHRIGYAREAGRASATLPSLEFPADLVAAELAPAGSAFAEAEIPDTVAQPTEGRRRGLWSMLEHRHREGLLDLARVIATSGVETCLAGVPIGRFGEFVTVDRREIEALRSVRSVIAEYCRCAETSPLSIAVLGPAGSGKSTIVRELIASAQPGATRGLTFNVSQFHSPQDLVGALHQVRDVALSGLIPIVFWDEFDTPLGVQPLGWLRYFLAPMQDGVFQEGQITHPIGRGIFVFAGSTADRMEAFVKMLDETKGAVKGTDFLSRLRGSIDVLGPNRVARADGASDPFHVIRRAMLLRSVVKRVAPHLLVGTDGSTTLSVDAGVQRAFLEVSRYEHGARSMEAIVRMSVLAGRERFERSALPAREQLDLHVNGAEFLALVRRPELEGDLLEKLAGATHETFRAGKERDGWTYGPEKSEEKKTHPLLVDWEDLPAVYREANRVSARSIPRKLAAAGYVITPARGDAAPFVFPGPDLEALARLEHELWMEAKLADGWTQGTATPDEPKRNEYLVEWSKVPPTIQQIDRDLVTDIPKMLARIGYTIVKIEQDDTKRRERDPGA
jgi:hypothetical protein